MTSFFSFPILPLNLSPDWRRACSCAGSEIYPGMNFGAAARRGSLWWHDGMTSPAQQSRLGSQPGQLTLESGRALQPSRLIRMR